MDRLIATNSVPFGSADLAPGSGTPQYATNGNPGNGTPATVWPAYAFNAMQDELMAILAAAQITADKANWSQVADALSGAIANTSAVSVTGADVTLTAAQYRPAVVVFSGVLTGNRNVIFPVKGHWRVINNCTGAFTLTCKTAAGTGVVVTQGAKISIWGDGTNIDTPPTTGTGANVLAANPTLTGTVTLSVIAGSVAGALSFTANGNIPTLTGANTSNYQFIASSTISAGTFDSHVQQFLTAQARNNASSLFWSCDDSGANRAQLRSNGGLANFSANNVNLSDARVKPEVQSLQDAKLIPALWNAHKSVHWSRFKYSDQTHDDWNYGYIAQDVREAFAEVAPELVDRWNDDSDLLAVHQEDLHNISHAVLAEAQRRIEALEGQVKSLRAA